MIKTTSRRTILAGMAVAPIATVPAVAGGAISDPAPDRAVESWRIWWTHTMEWHRLAADSRALWDSLPDDVKLPTVEIFEDPRDRKPKRAATVKEIERLTSPNAYWPMGEKERARRAGVRLEKVAELAALRRDAEAKIIASGHRAIADRMVAVSRLAQEAAAELEAMTATTTAAVAARCHVALDGLAEQVPDDCFDGAPESRGLAFLIRDLLPQLPADMAAAMAPVADGWRPLKDIWLAASWRQL